MRRMAVCMLLACAHSPPRQAPTAVAAEERGPAVDVSGWFGAERASLGASFRGIALGQTTPPTLPSVDTLGPEIGLELDMTGERFEGIVIGISDTVRQPRLCPVLLDRLAKAWGPPTDDRWESPARDRAVEFRTGDPPSCSLHFYRLVPPAQWLNATRGSVVPIWAIGRPITELKAMLAPLQPEERDPRFWPPSIEWHDISISGEQIELMAYYAHGRVIGIEVGLMGDRDLQAWQRLNAMFGAPGPCDVQTDNQRWQWNQVLGIVLDNWVGDLPSPAPGQPLGTQDMHPTTPNGLHTSIVFGVKPAPP